MNKKLITVFYNILSVGLIIFSMSISAKNLEKMTVILDWFVNPDHAPLFVAQQQGFYRDVGLDVQFIPPADPADPPKLVAAGKADLAVDYQPHLLSEINQGLPVRQVATLIDKPLGCLAVLADSSIKTFRDLKSKRIAYSTPMDTATLSAMLKHNGLTINDVELINVHYNLTQALLSKKVDAAVGFMRNFEPIELALAGHPVRTFYPEDNGVPSYDELVLITQANKVNDPKIKLFLQALTRGVQYLNAHPQQSWRTFAQLHPELNNTLNKRSWFATLPYFAKNPQLFNAKQCQVLANYLNNALKITVPADACMRSS